MKKNTLREYIREALLLGEVYISRQEALKLQQQHEFLKDKDLKSIMWMDHATIERLKKKHEDQKWRTQNPEEARKRDDEDEKSRSLSYVTDKNPTMVTGRQLHNIKTVGGGDIPSIAGMFDEIEDHIKSSDPESIKMMTLDVPKANAKSALTAAKHKFNIFANALKHRDSKTSYSLNDLTDSIFDNLSK